MSLHINARKEDIAPVVLMPGDPKRAEWIANTFLKDAKLVNSVRGMTAYTGYDPKGNRVTVFPSGMGMPSLSIYVTELYRDYDVECIIRVGTMGSYQPDVHLKDVVVASGSSCDSISVGSFIINSTFAAISDFYLTCAAYQSGKAKGINVHIGNVLSSNTFYDPFPDTWKKWAAMGILGVEMEAHALYCIAAGLHKKALAVCTVTDSFTEPDKRLSSEERQQSLTEMVEVAIGAIDIYVKYKW